MEFLIITGMSGAGKSTFVKVLEDIGYYCMDNIPPEFIPKLGELYKRGVAGSFAVVSDSRSLVMGSGTLMEAVEELKTAGVEVKIVFLDSNDDTLKKRFKETRRRLPLMSSTVSTMADALTLERRLLADARSRADFVIDTTYLTTNELKQRARELFVKEKSSAMEIRVQSFGFKYGAPSDADLIFDVRCMPNPHYIDELRPKTGLNVEVRDYIFSFDESNELLYKLKDLLDFLIPHYQSEGKSQLVIAFGCTGGKHRSVTYAYEIQHHLKDYNRVSVLHRDIEKV